MVDKSEIISIKRVVDLFEFEVEFHARVSTSATGNFYVCSG